MIPDNYTAFEGYESEQDRLKRIHKRHELEEELEPEELPFYDDYIGVRETFGKGN